MALPQQKKKALTKKVIGTRSIHFSKSGMNTIHNHKPNVHPDKTLKFSRGSHGLRERLEIYSELFRFSVAVEVWPEFWQSFCSATFFAGREGVVKQFVARLSCFFRHPGVNPLGRKGQGVP